MLPFTGTATSFVGVVPRPKVRYVEVPLLCEGRSPTDEGRNTYKKGEVVLVETVCLR